MAIVAASGIGRLVVSQAPDPDCAEVTPSRKLQARQAGGGFARRRCHWFVSPSPRSLASGACDRAQRPCGASAALPCKPGVANAMPAAKANGLHVPRGRFGEFWRQFSGSRPFSFTVNGSRFCARYCLSAALRRSFRGDVAGYPRETARDHAYNHHDRRTGSFL